MGSRNQGNRFEQSQQVYQHGGSSENRVLVKHVRPSGPFPVPPFNPAVPPPNLSVPSTQNMAKSHNTGQQNSHLQPPPFGERGSNGSPQHIVNATRFTAQFQPRNNSIVYSRKDARQPATNWPVSSGSSLPHHPGSGSSMQFNFRNANPPFQAGADKAHRLGSRAPFDPNASNGAPFCHGGSAGLPFDLTPRSGNNEPSHSIKSTTVSFDSGFGVPSSTGDTSPFRSGSNIPVHSGKSGGRSFDHRLGGPFSSANNLANNPGRGIVLSFSHGGRAPFSSGGNIPVNSGTGLSPGSNLPFPLQPPIPAPSPVFSTTHITSQEELDKVWLKQWLEQRQIKPSVTVPRKTLKIGEAHSLLQKGFSLNEQLKNIRDELIKSIDLSDVEWNTFLTRANEIKNELLSIQEMLSDPVVINDLQDKIAKRKKKRLWFKNRMKRRYLDKLEDQKRREKLHEKIDAWQKEIMEQDLAARKEASLKHEAGGVLGEVRRKLQDARKLLELLKSVKKLREIRKSEGEKKGVYPKTSTEADRKFTEKSDYLEKLVSKRMESYEDEEKAVRVMIVEEEEEREKKEEQERLEQKALLNLSKDSDPLADFRRYYGQAEERIEYLIQIRREWDAYLVPDHVFGASRIPDGDVSPAPPSSDLWSAVLKDSEAG